MDDHKTSMFLIKSTSKIMIFDDQEVNKNLDDQEVNKNQYFQNLSLPGST